MPRNNAGSLAGHKLGSIHYCHTNAFLISHNILSTMPLLHTHRYDMLEHKTLLLTPGCRARFLFGILLLRYATTRQLSAFFLNITAEVPPRFHILHAAARLRMPRFSFFAARLQACTRECRRRLAERRAGTYSQACLVTAAKRCKIIAGHTIIEAARRRRR